MATPVDKVGEPTPSAAPVASALRAPTPLAIAGIAVGAVLATGLLFGGGVAVGLALPAPGGSGQASAGQAPSADDDRGGGGPRGSGGQRQGRPGDQRGGALRFGEGPRDPGRGSGKLPSRPGSPENPTLDGTPPEETAPDS